MDKETFLKSFEDVLQTEENLNYNTILEDLDEWDSVSKIATIAFLDKNFGIKLTLNELKDFSTVGDIASKAGV